MPKDRRVNSSSFDHRSMVFPYSCSSKISDLTNPETFSPQAGDEKEWEEVRCPICMEHPHNAILLLCSSREKGCRPFICDTSYRHSNCLDQFLKSTSSSSSSSQPLHVCPLCRGTITSWDVINPARIFMNSKTRSCSLETCNFSGNYAELRKHARRAHPYERPSEASPSRKSDWMLLEQQLEMEDALAHQSDAEHDWDDWLNMDVLGDNALWSDGSFFDFPSGMTDIEDELIDEMFSGLSMSFMSLYSSFPDEELLDSGSSRSTVINLLSSDQVENSTGDFRPMSRSSYHQSENGETNVLSRLRRGENGEANVQSVSRHSRDNGLALSTRLSNQRPSYHGENGSVSRSRANYHEENVQSRSGTRSRYGVENTRTRSRARSRYE